MQHKVLVDYELAVAQNGFIVRAMLRLAGRAPSLRNRIPLNLSIVLDRSGSMAGEKLEAARDAAALLIRRLHPDDVVSVVAYDEEVTTVAEPATGEEQAALQTTVRAIEPGGSTNLSGGWLRGHELVANGRREGGVNRVMLMTDGRANAGITDPRALVGLCRTACASGVTTTTLGFGADYDERLLREMADAGGASTYYIERPDQAAGVFEEELEGLLTLSAQNVTVHIRPTAHVQLAAVRHHYPMTRTRDEVRLELGDLYAREPKALLVEFFVPGLGDATDVRIAEVVVHAHVLTDGGGVERQEIRFPIVSALSPEGHTEPEVRREVLLLDAARARDAARERHDRGDDPGAGAILREMSALLRASPEASTPELEEQADDLVTLAAQFERSSVSDMDRKYMAQRAYNAHRGKRGYEEKLARRKRPPGR